MAPRADTKFNFPTAITSLFAIFGFPFAWVVNQFYNKVIHPVFVTFGGFGLKIPLPGLPDVTIHPFGFLLTIDNSLQTFFGSMVAALEHAIVQMFHIIVSSLGGLAAELGNLAVAVEKKLVNLGVLALHKGLAALRGTLSFILRRIQGIEAFFRHLPALVKRLATAAAHKVVALVLRVLPKIWKRLTHGLATTWRELKKLRHLIRNPDALWSSKHIMRLVRKGLKFLGLEWLLNNNVGQIGRWLWRHPLGDVIEWVKDALNFFFPQDICSISQYSYDVAVYVFEPVIQETIGLTSHICGDQSKLLASAMGDDGPYLEAWAPSATPPITGPYTPERLAPGIPLPRGVVKA